MCARIEKGCESFDYFQANSRGPFHQGIGPQQHCRPNVSRGETGPGCTAMLPEREFLDVRELLWPDVLVRHGAKERCHTINLLRVVDRPADDIPRSLQP